MKFAEYNQLIYKIKYIHAKTKYWHNLTSKQKKNDANITLYAKNVENKRLLFNSLEFV